MSTRDGIVNEELNSDEQEEAPSFSPDRRKLTG
ncbi:hypothetical protein JOD43_002208 [Pullulanibacillus pueri]|nr:hypothetical protein [Pullulanibacillus pueri]